MREYIAVVLVGMLLLVAIPVVITQLTRSEPRQLEGVRLDETVHEEICFQNREQGIQLCGLLFVPDDTGPFPAAVVIHGSGSSLRDNRWYLTLAQHLQDNGILVLLPDKRGSEQSGGDWRTASFEDLAADTVAAVEYLREQDEVEVSNIGVIGLSQGGHIAPLVADKSDELSYLINIVGGAVPMHDLLVYEESHNLRELGILPSLSDLLAYPSAWSLIYARQKGFWDTIGNFDPLPFWEKIEIPSLVLYGEEDNNVPSNRSAEILRSLNNRNIEVRIYEGSGHALESPEGEGNSILRPEALMEIVSFVLGAGDS